MNNDVKNVFKRKDGRFEARYPYGLKADGSTNYNSVYGKTEAEVIEKRKREMSEKIKNNDLLIFDKKYFGHDIYIWLRSIQIRCKKTTVSNYEYTVFGRIVPKFSKINRKYITSEFINEYTAELLEDEKLLPKTVKDILVLLQQILVYSGININISMPKVPKNEIQILTKQDQTILEEYLINHMTLTELGIYLCLYTGLRIGELCALKWDNIDLKNRSIKIKHTITRIKNPDRTSTEKTVIIIDEPKSISSIREIPIPDFIIPLLIKFKENANSNCFLLTGTEKYVETRTYFNRYKKILDTIKLQQYNFHALRHTFATRCVENGCDPKTLSEILGHSSVKITLERYVHPTYENKVKMMNQLKPMYN